MTASPMAGRKALEAIANGDADIALVSNYLEFRDEAFDLLVHEKLSADESFRIFVTLTNDVLGQLKTNRSKNLKI
jgi:hypothetical protein